MPFVLIALLCSRPLIAKPLPAPWARLLPPGQGLVTPETWEALRPEHRTLLTHLQTQREAGFLPTDRVAACFTAEGYSPKALAELEAAMSGGGPGRNAQLRNRWTSTATNGPLKLRQIRGGKT
jgi:hypothetical protein